MNIIAQRGVVAEVVDRSVLSVTRHGESFSIDAGVKLTCLPSSLAVFLGSSTDRYLAVPTESRDGGLHVFDLEERTCAKFGVWDNADLIHAMVCSWSGRHVAVVVGDRRWQVQSILVTSIDLAGRSMSTVSIVDFHHKTGLGDVLLPCFVGTRASMLVGVRLRDGNVFALGHEDVATGTWVERVPDCIGRVPGDIEDVVGVSGTDSMLALVGRPNKESAWAVMEVIVSPFGFMPAKELKWYQRDALSIRHESRWYRGDALSIRHEIGTGAHVCVEGGSCVVLPQFYSMNLGVLRQCWMEACIRSGMRVHAYL